MFEGCTTDGEDQVLERQVRICKAFASSTRLRMLDLLGKQPHSVSDLQNALGLPMPNVSQHLAILKSAGIVSTRREGKQTVYFLAIPEVKDACKLLRDVLRAQLRSDRELEV